MRPRHQCQAIVVVESLTDILPESVSSTSRADSPSTPVVWVRPQQITHWSLMRHFLNAVEGANVVQRVNAWRQASVQAEDLVVDERGKWEVVEEIGEELPHIRIAVLAQTLVVEAVHLRNLSTLVVAAEDGDALGVADLQRDQEGDGLDGEVSTIDVVAHEEVVCVWVGAADLEELHQVVELAVDVAADGDWAFHGLYVGLVLQHFARFFA